MLAPWRPKSKGFVVVTFVEAAGRYRLLTIMSDVDEDLVEASDEEVENVTAAEVLRRLEEVRIRDGLTSGGLWRETYDSP